MKGNRSFLRSDRRAGSGWMRNGKPASPLRKGGRRRRKRRRRRTSGRSSGSSSSSSTQLDGAEQKQEEEKKDDGEQKEEVEREGNEKGVAKRSETGPPAKGEKELYRRDPSLRCVYTVSLSRNPQNMSDVVRRREEGG